MIFLYTSVFIFCIVGLPCTSSVFSERRLLCSSEQISVWFSYEGPLYYLSLTASACSQKVKTYVVTYTLIPMVTVAQAGYHARIYAKGQLWFEYTQPYVPCEDVQICYIIKGETLHETCLFYFKRKSFLAAQGEYEIYLDVNIVDDAQKQLTLHFNITLQVKSTDSKNAIFRQLGGVLEKKIPANTR